AHAVGPSHDVGSVDGRGADGFGGFHAPLDHFGKLLPVIAMRINSAIGGESHEGSSLERLAEVFPLQAAYLSLFCDRLRQNAVLGAFGEDVVVIVDIEVEISVMLLGKRNAFIVDQAA